MNSIIFISLVFAGIFQGLFLSAFILLNKKRKTKASKYLGLLILSFTLSNLFYIMDEIGIISWHVFNLVYLPYSFLIAPFLYFFAMYYIDPERTEKRLESIFYLPALAALLVTLTYKLIALTTQRTVDNDPFMDLLANLIDVYGDFVNIPFFLTALILLLIRIYRIQKQNSFHFSIIKVELQWIKILLWVLLLVTVIPWSIYTYTFYKNVEMYYLPMFAITSLIVYLIGYIGIHKIGILNERKKIRSYSKAHFKNIKIKKSKNGYIDKIEKILLEERRYLDPNISLESLAEELQLSKSHLSRIINAELNLSFSAYINSLRIEDAKRYLKNPEFSNYTLVAIGLEAGFNSKSTFNTVFKKYTGLTPSQFKKNTAN